MKYLQSGLGSILAICLVIRVAAWLLAPALPLIIVLFVLVAILVRLIGWGSHL
jgi:hypothetical protein